MLGSRNPRHYGNKARKGKNREVEFVLDGDESDVGAASIALGGKLFEAMTSDTAGPRALGAAEHGAVDS